MRDGLSRAQHRARIDRNIHDALNSRKRLRGFRVVPSSGAWDRLDRELSNAASVLRSMKRPSTLVDELFAYAAYLAREIEVAESLALEPAAELHRLRDLAPYALEALDALTLPLARPGADEQPELRALASAFGGVRGELARALLVSFGFAA